MRVTIENSAKKLLNENEYNELLEISESGNIFEGVYNFDIKLGGVGIHNINDFKKRGRYHIRDRDIFRPFQYIEAYLDFDQPHIEWVTREIVHMCGLHLECLVKRLTGQDKLPLGQGLMYAIAEYKLDKQTVSYIRVILQPYNDAKHRLSQEMDTHLFNMKQMLICYGATRKLSLKVMPMVKLYTDPSVWNGNINLIGDGL
ncbi:hypothetical protein BKP35_17390 [Anaerobacillus arseniciselenatis]|uniref:Uncharacterized protein n=1 Tax=Anaerobacillus arseniciselenatis TaxID=85682 RepID=A0A1S2L8N8_9BACI|nr:hypothetical protein [Anaerobacillus arseniciselenatis]OIJ08858.1 hypothetical protein BKP35_17390 [Anaerobacillus arseniciselenatis]